MSRSGHLGVSFVFKGLPFRIGFVALSVSDKSGYRFCRQTRGKTKGQSLSGDSVIVRQTLESVEITRIPLCVAL